MTILGEGDIALAGEYVLGLLDPVAEASAAARVATDADFAGEVEAWQTRLQPMIEGTDTAARPSVWEAVVANLPQATGQDIGRGAVRVWQALAGASTMAAAILAALLLQQSPSAVAPAPASPLVAALGSETGGASLTARYDSQSGKMLLTPVSLDTGALYPELWVVPADGQARSLGMVRGDSASEIVVSPEMRQFVGQGAILAITPEPQSGAPGGKATGPIIASGKITTV